jgi:hypothetical protein
VRVGLAWAAERESAGSIEFLYEPATGRFHLLEMCPVSDGTRGV